MIKTHLNPRPEAAESTGIVLAPGDRKRLLLVEGDGFTRLVLLLRLRLAGFGVEFTSNGILGLGKLRSCHPDILLVELKLNGMSGLELIKAARAEPEFGNRPIYVFTYANRMNRAARREVDQLGATLLDKNSVTREDLVQIFANTFLKSESETGKAAANSESEPPASVVSEVVASGAIEELVAGVREQAELFARETKNRPACGNELLSRVSSLASCAKAAGLPNLARHGRALENFLKPLCATQHPHAKKALATVARAVELMSRMSFETPSKEQTLSQFTAVFVDEATASNCAMLQALVDAGFQPSCFEDPRRGREYLANHPTDIIVANLVLPEAHGLGLADIRQLPLHGETPVIFGPDSTVTERTHEELPMGAPRLDKSRLVLSELVLDALNEVLGRNVPAADLASPPSANATSISAAAAVPDDDHVELFAKSPRQAAAPVSEGLVKDIAASAVANRQPQRFEHLFAAAGIPSEPILRAKPSTTEVDHQAEVFVELPATSIDGFQAEDQVVETVSTSVLQTEPPPPLQEPGAEDQTIAATFHSGGSGVNGQPVSEENLMSESEQNQVSVRESATAISNYWEAMNNQLSPASAEEVQQVESDRAAVVPVAQDSPREDLVARICAAEMALYHAQAQAEEKDKAIVALQKELSEAKANPADGAQPSKDAQSAQARCAELEEEVTALRQAIEGLNGSFGEPQASSESEKQLKELQEKLNENSAQLEKQKEEQLNAQTEFNRQLEAANAAGKQNESARQQAEGRCAELEKELSSLRQAQANNTTPEKKANPQSTEAKSSSDSWPGLPASELEQQVRQGVAALAKATSELAKERGERQRSHQRVVELNGRVQTLHEDLSRTLKSQHEDLARITALEEQNNQVNQALEKHAADLEQHQAERRLAEEQLQKTKDANLQLRKDLAFFQDANKKFEGARQELQNRLEASLSAARETQARHQHESAEHHRLTESLEEAKRELQSQSRKREALEQELQATQDTLREREAKLQNEAAERQRLNRNQDSAQRNLRDGSERDLEFSKVQTALQLEQVERKRQESQLARMRQSALDSAHAARALRTSLRRQIREPVDNMVHSARSLLELEMGDDQKKLAEAVLQDVLLVQTRLREPGFAQAEHHESSGKSNPTTT